MDWSVVAGTAFVIGWIAIVFIHFWRQESKDKRPIRMLERDEDWLPYALLTDMLENERLRHERDDHP